MRVIFVVGESLSGKDTLASRLHKRLSQNHSAAVYRYSFSELITLELTNHGLPLTRENYQKAALEIQQQRGNSVFRDYIRSKLFALQVRDPHAYSIVCGGRFLDDLCVLEGFESVCVAIEVAESVLLERTRHSQKEKQYMTLTEFRASRNHPAEGNIRALIDRADIRITNNKSRCDFLRTCDELTRKLFTGWCS